MAYKYSVERGDFGKKGARVTGLDEAVFTFETKSSQSECAINLYNYNAEPCTCNIGQNSKFAEKVMSVPVTDECRTGRLVSIKIKGIPVNELCYLLEENKAEYMDSYASVVVGRDIWADESRQANEFKVFAGFADLSDNWKDHNVTIEPKDMVIYKLHLRGITAATSSGKNKGTWAALVNRLDYIKNLGITSIELMPVYDFEDLFYEKHILIERDGSRRTAIETLGKINYWGYGDAFYFAPKASYFGGASQCVKNMRKLVSEIHLRGMECIMEMSFGINTPDDLMIDALHSFVLNYHVDGFHILGCNAPIERIAADPILASTKIFYEHFDQELLSKEKDKKHLFIYDDSFMYVGRQMANHMNGSMVQFANHMRRQNSDYGFVNYSANVNGFTLYDSVSYGEKHNFDNGEDNKDGSNTNYTSNYGYEGETHNKAIIANRYLHMRNALCMAVFGQGIPLILAGDEVANTAMGNNNPYCQDNKIGWTVFSKSKDKLLLQQFLKDILTLRRQHPCIRQENAMQMSDYKHTGFPDMSYHSYEPWSMSIGQEQMALGILYAGAYTQEDQDLYICYNFHYDEAELALPRLETGKRWRLLLNTSQYCEDYDMSPKVIDNQQSIKVPGSSISVLVGMNI